MPTRITFDGGGADCASTCPTDASVATKNARAPIALLMIMSPSGFFAPVSVLDLIERKTSFALSARWIKQCGSFWPRKVRKRGYYLRRVHKITYRKASPRGSPLPLYSGGEGPGVRGSNPQKTQLFARHSVPPHPCPLPPEYRGEREWRSVSYFGAAPNATENGFPAWNGLSTGCGRRTSD